VSRKISRISTGLRPPNTYLIEKLTPRTRRAAVRA
jgi:hypothetical protein